MGRIAVTIPSGKPPKHERLGLSKKKMRDAQAIYKNPEAVTGRALNSPWSAGGRVGPSRINDHAEGIG